MSAMNRHDWEHALDRIRHGSFRPDGIKTLREYADSAYEREELLRALISGYSLNYNLLSVAKATRHKEVRE